MLVREAYGKVLRDTRKEQLYTLRSLSEVSGISLGYLCEIENGLKEPSSYVLEDICDTLHMEVSEFLVLAARSMEEE